MKTNKMLRSAKWVVACGAAVLALAACGSDGSVPSAYQGSFQDSSGVSLNLTSSTASLQIEGKTLAGKVAPVDYNKLMQGQPGFYIDQKNKKDTLLDVYWITPDPSTKQEAGGMVYYTTDIVYLQIDLNQKSAVPAITIVHADDGTVMLDTQSKEWQAGWPAHSTEYNLVRVANQKAG